MTKSPEPAPASAPTPVGPPLDRHAARRAHAALKTLPHVLPEASVHVLAQEVISRLAARGTPDCEQTTIDMADALASADDKAGMRLTMRLIKNGWALEDVYLTHLAGAARLLGDRWSTDDLTSAQVTIAAARIYAIMRGLSGVIAPEVWPDGRHAVFATIPGEQHTLGVTMAADLFRHDGWDVDLMVGREHDELLSELAQTEYAILGLSAMTPGALPELIRLIVAVRVSQPHVKIVVGGRMAETEPRLQEVTDADAVSSNLDTLREAMRQFHDTIAARPGIARG